MKEVVHFLLLDFRWPNCVACTFQALMKAISNHFDMPAIHEMLNTMHSAMRPCSCICKYYRKICIHTRHTYIHTKFQPPTWWFYIIENWYSKITTYSLHLCARRTGKLHAMVQLLIFIETDPELNEVGLNGKVAYKHDVFKRTQTPMDAWNRNVKADLMTPFDFDSIGNRYSRAAVCRMRMSPADTHTHTHTHTHTRSSTERSHMATACANTVEIRAKPHQPNGQPHYKHNIINNAAPFSSWFLYNTSQKQYYCAAFCGMSSANSLNHSKATPPSSIPTQTSSKVELRQCCRNATEEVMMAANNLPIHSMLDASNAVPARRTFHSWLNNGQPIRKLTKKIIKAGWNLYHFAMTVCFGRLCGFFMAGLSK